MDENINETISVFRFLIYNLYNFWRLEAYSRNSLSLFLLLLLPTFMLKYHHSLIMIPRLYWDRGLQDFFAFLMCVVVAFGIPYQHLTVLFHSKHPIVSSQKRNRYPHSLKDTCRASDDLRWANARSLWFLSKIMLNFKSVLDVLGIRDLTIWTLTIFVRNWTLQERRCYMNS